MTLPIPLAESGQFNWGVLVVLLVLEPFCIFLVLALLPAITGWKRVADRFPRRHPPTGQRFGWCSMRFGAFGNYNNCVLIHSSAEGVDLAMPPVFNWFHKPIFIPWAEMKNAENFSSLFAKGVSFQAGAPSAGTILLPEKAFAEMPGGRS